MAALSPHWPCSWTSISVRGIFPNPRNSGVIIPLKASSSTESPSPTSSNSPGISPKPEPPKIDPVKIAFAKAKAYKKGVQLQQTSPSSQTGDIIEVKPRDSKNETETVTEPEPEPPKIDPVKIAFAKARAYKKGVQLQQSNPSSQTGDIIEAKPRDGKNETETMTEPEPEPAKIDPVKIAFAKAKAYKKGVQLQQTNPSSQTGDIIEAKPSDSKNETETMTEQEPAKIDPVKIAFAKAKAYKKGVQLQQTNPSSQTGDNIEVKPRDSKNETETVTDNQSTQVDVENRAGQEFPTSVKLAMDRAKKYKMNKENTLPVGSSNENREVVETEEIIKKKSNEKVSKMDFIGLGFSDKRKTRGLPAGLVPLADPFPDRDPGEVEIIVGDKSKFGNATVSQPESNEDDDKSNMYKPKVSTWGVFPRPVNISKTYGGGRTIQPGESLETDEDKAAKEARTKELLSQYKKQTGLKVDPMLRDECEKDMKNGDALMEKGKLRDALPYYEKIMEKLAFQNELHGMAALQWSICQDSVGRQSEARVMYERLQSHPNYSVRKSAKQFMFGFQAMDMMKVGSMDMSKVNMGYQNYFEAFIKDKTSDYSLKDIEETDNVGIWQVLPYVAFIVSPIFLVLLVALTKAR